MAKKQTKKDPETETVATEAVAEPTGEPTPTKRVRRAKVITQDATPPMADPAITPTPDAPTVPTKQPKAKRAVVGDATPPAPTQAPKKGKAKRADATLADVFAGYLRSLEEAGKSDGTCFSYRLELVMAGAELGTDTRIADLTTERVALFFGSDRVTKTRGGRPKSPLSIEKTRRVVRQALQWAETNGLVAKAPVPELTASH